MQLQKTGQNLPQRASKLHREVIKAQESPRIKDFTSDQLRDLATAQAMQVATSRGMKGLDADVMLSIQTLLPKLLESQYPNLTVSEIELAFLRGLNGEYDNTYGVSYEVLAKWLKAYKNERLSVMKKQTEYLVAQNNKKALEKSEAESQQAIEKMHKSIMDMVAHFKETGEMPEDDPGNYIYNHLNSRGMVNITDKRKHEAMEQAKIEIKKEKLESTANPFKLNEITKQLKNGLSENAVISKAKKILLREIFEAV